MKHTKQIQKGVVAKEKTEHALINSNNAPATINAVEQNSRERTQQLTTTTKKSVVTQARSHIFGFSAIYWQDYVHVHVDFFAHFFPGGWNLI